jgi:hypothetical protein
MQAKRGAKQLRAALKQAQQEIRTSRSAQQGLETRLAMFDAHAQKAKQS